jgi:hypothetical protein
VPEALEPEAVKGRGGFDMSDQAMPSEVIITIQVKVSVSPSGAITTHVIPNKPVSVKDMPLDSECTIETVNAKTGKVSGVPDFLPIPDPIDGMRPYDVVPKALHSKNGHTPKKTGACERALRFIELSLQRTPEGVYEREVAKELEISDGAVWFAIDKLVKAHPELYERFKDVKKRGRPVGIRVIPGKAEEQKSQVLFCQKCKGLLRLQNGERVCPRCTPEKVEGTLKDGATKDGDDEP